VEQTCEQVIIITRGKVVATDTVQHLTNRLQGTEGVLLEVESRGGPLDSSTVLQRLEQVSGVSRVLFKETRGSRQIFEVESLQGRTIRGELARAVVEGGWNLNELRSVSVSLEEVFLQLTGTDPVAEGGVQ
jgi:ABC-type multidrug transport system, ATPase component